MTFIIALDLNGHLVEIRDSFETYADTIKYLHKWYKSYKDMEVYIIDYSNGLDQDPLYGAPYKFNIETYYSCEDGVYHETSYHDLDQGLGLKEIGKTYLVNYDLLPQNFKDDNELVELAIEKWINSHYESSNPPKPIWLI